MWSITTLKLPDVIAFRHWLSNRPEPSSDDTTAVTATEDTSMVGGRKDDDAGMGRVRMAMVKMGCKVNLDAPNTVSFTSLNLSRRTADMLGLRYWGTDLLYPGTCYWRQQAGIGTYWYSDDVAVCPLTAHSPILTKPDLKGSTHAHQPRCTNV
jgi:hypothetical protein